MLHDLDCTAKVSSSARDLTLGRIASDHALVTADHKSHVPELKLAVHRPNLRALLDAALLGLPQTCWHRCSLAAACSCAVTVRSGYVCKFS